MPIKQLTWGLAGRHIRRLASPTPPAPPWEDLSFEYTGSEQYVTLYPGTYLFKLWGAQGGPGNGAAGGLGGYAEGRINISALTDISIRVGGTGLNSAPGAEHTPGGWNGGGMAYKSMWDDYRDAGSGGGASDIRIGGSALADRLIVAGGGGGGGGASGANVAGVGGGLSGGNAANGGGVGGTQSAGGNVGGALGLGGDHVNYWAGSGGGGGYYGGGASPVQEAGGGGGSSYIGHASISDGLTLAGQRSGNGRVTIEKIA